MWKYSSAFNLFENSQRVYFVFLCLSLIPIYQVDTVVTAVFLFFMSNQIVINNQLHSCKHLKSNDVIHILCTFALIFFWTLIFLNCCLERYGQNYTVAIVTPNDGLSITVTPWCVTNGNLFFFTDAKMSTTATNERIKN